MRQGIFREVFLLKSGYSSFGRGVYYRVKNIFAVPSGHSHSWVPKHIIQNKFPCMVLLGKECYEEGEDERSGGGSTENE